VSAARKCRRGTKFSPIGVEKESLTQEWSLTATLVAPKSHFPNRLSVYLGLKEEVVVK
jgi:hypothetical protein